MSNIPMSVYIERQRQQHLSKQPDTAQRRRDIVAFVAAHPLCSQEDIAKGMNIGVHTVKREMVLLTDKVLPAYGRRGSGDPVRYIVKETATCAKG